MKRCNAAPLNCTAPPQKVKMNSSIFNGACQSTNAIKTSIGGQTPSWQKNNLQLYDLIEFAYHFELELRVAGAV